MAAARRGAWARPRWAGAGGERGRIGGSGLGSETRAPAERPKLPCEGLSRAAPAPSWPTLPAPTRRSRQRERPPRGPNAGGGGWRVPCARGAQKTTRVALKRGARGSTCRFCPRIPHLGALGVRRGGVRSVCRRHWGGKAAKKAMGRGGKRVLWRCGGGAHGRRPGGGDGGCGKACYVVVCVCRPRPRARPARFFFFFGGAFGGTNPSEAKSGERNAKRKTCFRFFQRPRSPTPPRSVAQAVGKTWPSSITAVPSHSPTGTTLSASEAIGGKPPMPF